RRHRGRADGAHHRPAGGAMSAAAPRRAGRAAGARGQRLRELREKIDAVDEKLQALLNRRAQYAQEIARAKEESGERQYYRPDREAEVLARVAERNRGPLPNDEVVRLFREIMSACLALESRLKVAFLGPSGTFTHDAALKHFGGSVEAVPLATIDEVF